MLQAQDRVQAVYSDRDDSFKLGTLCVVRGFKFEFDAAEGMLVVHAPGCCGSFTKVSDPVPAPMGAKQAVSYAAELQDSYHEVCTSFDRAAERR